MAAATRSGNTATAIPLDKRHGNLCNTGLMKSIRGRINLPDIPLRQPTKLIESAIDTAIATAIATAMVDGTERESGVIPIPVVIQLNSPLDFVSGERVIVSSTPSPAYPDNHNMYTNNIFQIGQLNPGTELVTIDITRKNDTITLENIKNYYSDITGVGWSDRRDNSEPFRFTINKSRCALLTMYKSHPNQLVVVFGPSPAAVGSAAAGSAGGSKRKRVISRKLKSLNKKRKYTQRLTRRRRYSYKGGRKN